MTSRWVGESDCHFLAPAHGVPQVRRVLRRTGEDAPAVRAQRDGRLGQHVDLLLIAQDVPDVHLG
jgi:hypothetical protein